MSLSLSSVSLSQKSLKSHFPFLSLTHYSGHESGAPQGPKDPVPVLWVPGGLPFLNLRAQVGGADPDEGQGGAGRDRGRGHGLPH